MTVRIRYLSALRDTTHVRMEEASLADGATLNDVSMLLAQKYGIKVPGPSVMGTVNGLGWSQASQGAATELHEGDEIALFPLLSGG